MRMPVERARGPGHPRVARVRRAQHRRARHGRVGIPRVVVALDGILQGVEDLGAIFDGPAEDAAAVAIDVRADGAPVEPQHRLVRKDERHRIVVGRSATGRPRLLAEAGHHEIRADRHARPRARAERGRAGGVVGIPGIAAPGAALVAQHRRQDLVGSVAAAGIARPPVVFRVDRLGEDDRPLGAELLDEHVIARGEVDVVARVTPGGGAHVLRVEGVLEREHHAIHGHRREIGIAPIRGVELGRALEGVRQPAEHLAHGGRAGGKRPRGRVPVEVAPAGDRPFTPNVEGGQRIHLPGIRLADDHPELLLHVGIGGRRLHAAVFEGRPLVLVEIGQDGGGLDGLRGKAQRRPRAHGARRLGDRGAVFRDEQAGHPVVGPHAVEVVLDDRDAGRLPRPDGRVQLLDRRLVQTKRLVRCAGLCCHDVASRGLRLMAMWARPSSRGPGRRIVERRSRGQRATRLPSRPRTSIIASFGIRVVGGGDASAGAPGRVNAPAGRRTPA